MKKTILILALLLISTPLYAHVLKTDGTVGAVIHVSPEDDPIAGEATSFFFELKDKENKFTPINCDCTASIIKAEKEIYAAPLFQNTPNPSLDDASFSFTFPERDIYKVRISGKPKIPEAFNSFTLEWDIRVSRISNSSAQDSTNAAPKKNHTVHYIVFGGAFLFGIGYVIYDKYKNKRETKS